MHQINNTNNTHENVLSMSKYKTNINFLPLHQNQKIWPLFCKNILKIKEKYMLGIYISYEIVEISGFVTNVHGCCGYIVTMTNIFTF